MKSRRTITAVLLAAALLGGCRSEKLPSRDEIPLLRQQFFALEQALKQKSAAGIDSLASTDLRAGGRIPDSLLAFVYGPAGEFGFTRFDDYTIFFNNELAIINCDLIDSSGAQRRPARFDFRKQDDRWLLKSYQTAAP